MSEGTQPSAGQSRAGVTIGNPDELYGSVMLVVLALIALAVSFYHPGNAGFFGPVMTPRVFAVLVGLAGAANAVGLLPIRNPQDFYGGVALIGLAVVAMLAAIDLPGMRGFAFGPGTAPRLFAMLLAVLGGGVAVGGLVFAGPKMERFAFRGPIFLTGSVLVFAATIRPLGLVISSFATIIVSAVATPDVKWRETLIWAVILTTFCALLFPYALNLPFQLWPRF
jgi:putative tricarboxylic transport membrane protein